MQFLESVSNNSSPLVRPSAVLKNGSGGRGLNANDDGVIGTRRLISAADVLKIVRPGEVESSSSFNHGKPKRAPLVRSAFNNVDDERAVPIKRHIHAADVLRIVRPGEVNGSCSSFKKSSPKVPLLQKERADVAKPLLAISPPSSSSWDLLSLIEERKWPELRKFVRRSDDSSAAPLRGVFASIRRISQMQGTHPAAASCDDDDDDGNALHLLCSYRPPRDVVSLLCRKFPSYLFETDSMGRTPLHVAVDYKASAEAVSALLEEARCCTPPSSSNGGEDLLTRRRDALGKTPLMHACENATSTADSDSDGVRRSNGVIKALVSADPYSVLVEDCCERTALEFAIFAGAPDRVVRALQGTMIRAAKDVNRMERERRYSEDREAEVANPKKEWLERATSSSEPQRTPASPNASLTNVPKVTPPTPPPSSSDKTPLPRRARMARREGSTAPALAAAIAAATAPEKRRKSQGWDRPAAATSA